MDSGFSAVYGLSGSYTAGATLTIGWYSFLKCQSSARQPSFIIGQMLSGVWRGRGGTVIAIDAPSDWPQGSVGQPGHSIVATRLTRGELLEAPGDDVSVGYGQDDVLPCPAISPYNIAGSFSPGVVGESEDGIAEPLFTLLLFRRWFRSWVSE